MRAHAEAFKNRLEALGFFADAGPGSPPPGLVNEGSVRRIHEADDAMIHIAWQVGGKVSGAEARTEFDEVGDGPSLCCLTFSTGAGTSDIHPGVTVALITGEGGRIDAGGVEVVVAGERRDQLATAAAWLELPAVIAAGDAIAIKPTFAEWDSAMRATVAHGEDASIAAAAEHKRDAEEHRLYQLAFAESVGAQRGVPVVVDESRAGALDGHSGFACGDERHVEQK